LHRTRELNLAKQRVHKSRTEIKIDLRNNINMCFLHRHRALILAKQWTYKSWIEINRGLNIDSRTDIKPCFLYQNPALILTTQCAHKSCFESKHCLRDKSNMILDSKSHIEFNNALTVIHLEPKSNIDQRNDIKPIFLHRICALSLPRNDLSNLASKSCIDFRNDIKPCSLHRSRAFNFANK
jgi:hypothetical protein